MVTGVTKLSASRPTKAARCDKIVVVESTVVVVAASGSAAPPEQAAVTGRRPALQPSDIHVSPPISGGADEGG
jgi:hypothetical protein